MSNSENKVFPLYKAGVFQYESRKELPTDRIERLEQAIKQATEKVDLIVCPELFMSGYGDLEDIKRYAEQVDGPFAKSISRLAIKFNTSIIYGYPELQLDKLYNSAQCFNKEGQFVINHRKTILPKTGYETELFSSGQQNSTMQIEDMNIGLVICYELEFPEIVREAAKNKINVIIAPTGQSNKWPAAARHISRSRAFENGIFVIYANYCGTNNDINFMGESKIINPKGLDIIVAKDKEKLIIGEIDLNMIRFVRKKLPYLEDSKKIKI